MRHSLELTLIVLVAGCSPAVSPGEQPIATPVTVAIDEELSAGDPAVWKRLGTEPLEGLALVWGDAVLHPTAASARKASPKRADGKHPRVVHIVADEGDVVKVRTWLSPRVRQGMPELTSWDLTLYATREQLVPVLKQPVTKTFEDGSGFAFFEGLPVRIGKSIRPRDGLLSKVDVQLDPAKVGLSFPMKGDDPEIDTGGAELGCDAQFSGEDAKETTRIYHLKDEIEREMEKVRRKRRKSSHGGLWSTAVPLGMAQRLRTCTFPGPTYGATDGAELSPLMLGGRSLMSPLDVPGDRCRTMFEVKEAPTGDRVLVNLPLGRAVVRLSAAKSDLREGGRCGGIAMGGGYGSRRKPPPPPKVLAVVGKAKAYFPDGELAGYHMRGTTKMRDAERVGKRLCIEHRNVSVKLCFDRDDLEKVVDR